MKTLTRPAKKPVLAPAAPRSAQVKKFPGLAISPITGLYFNPLKPGQKPISRETLKAALADSL